MDENEHAIIVTDTIPGENIVHIVRMMERDHLVYVKPECLRPDNEPWRRQGKRKAQRKR